MPQPKGKKVKKTVEPEVSVEDGEAVQMAVSYTHLDVYKRQVFNGILLC